MVRKSAICSSYLLDRLFAHSFADANETSAPKPMLNHKLMDFASISREVSSKFEIDSAYAESALVRTRWSIVSPLLRCNIFSDQEWLCYMNILFKVDVTFYLRKQV